MFEIDSDNPFGDIRLEKRRKQLSNQLFWKWTRTIKQLSVSPGEQKPYYRLLRNEKVTEKKLIDQVARRCSKGCAGKLVLAIQDSTEINLSKHRHRLDHESGIGSLGTSEYDQIGFNLHPSVVMDALTGFPIGFSDIRIWDRAIKGQNKKERNYQKLAIEEKESYKWIESSEKSKQCLKDADAIIVIQDREGDIYEQFERIPSDNCYLLTRSRTNRTLQEGGKLWDSLGAAPLAGTYSLHIDSDSHSKEPGRDATIEVRYIKAKICLSQQNKGKNPIEIYAVEAKEINSTAKEPVLWRLVTTWPIENFDVALMVITWYTCRWVIEEIFRMLKKEGFNIEGSELESGWAIRKMCVMVLDTILKLLQLHIAYNTPEDLGPAVETAFETNEIACLKQLNTKMEGKTVALINPSHPKSLKWAAWIIARTGGWKGYQSQRPPGMTTLLTGLRKYYDIFDGWTLQKDVGTR